MTKAPAGAHIVDDALRAFTQFDDSPRSSGELDKYRVMEQVREFLPASLQEFDA